MLKKIRKTFFVSEINVPELVALNCIKERIFAIDIQFVNKQSQDFSYH